MKSAPQERLIGNQEKHFIENESGQGQLYTNPK